MSKYYLTKLVLQTQSPMAINTGQREVGFDTQLIRDINGLPIIPASAIAGVWGHIAQDIKGEQFKQQWFGGEHFEKEGYAKLSGSRISINNARLLNSKNQISKPFELNENLSDPLYTMCLQERPHHRERVSLNDRGVAKDHGKFDQILLPKGVRFAVNIKFESDTDAEITQFKELLALWNDPRMAFGSGTRNGLGRVDVVKHESQEFDLNDGSSVAVKMQEFLSTSINKSTDIADDSDKSMTLLATMPLQALDNWRYGQGVRPLTTGDDGRDADILTYTEPQIEWQNNTVNIKHRVVFCGSSIKGILAHRIAFHYRRHVGEYAESMAESSHEDWQKKPEALHDLFGYADEKDHSASKAGVLFVEDAEVEYSTAHVRYHNSIDRFTGGVRQGALFTEELLYQPTFTLRLWIQKDAKLSTELKAAIFDTLDDIKSGLLPMGAGSGRGTSLVMLDEDKAQDVYINNEYLANAMLEDK